MKYKNLKRVSVGVQRIDFKVGDTLFRAFISQYGISLYRDDLIHGVIDLDIDRGFGQSNFIFKELKHHLPEYRAALAKVRKLLMFA